MILVFFDQDYMYVTTPFVLIEVGFVAFTHFTMFPSTKIGFAFIDDFIVLVYTCMSMPRWAVFVTLRDSAVGCCTKSGATKVTPTGNVSASVKEQVRNFNVEDQKN